MRPLPRVLLYGITLSLMTGRTCAALTAHLITAPSLVNHTFGTDLRIGTADDTVTNAALPPNDSAPNGHGAASFSLLTVPGADPLNYAYILFVDGTIEFTPNYAGSTADNLVLTVAGGSLRSTDEFNYPSRGEATTTISGGTAQMNPMTGAATVDLTGTFTVNVGMATLSLANQTLTAAPGKAKIVVPAVFGHSGDAYVDQVLVPLVPNTATAIVLVEFTGTVSSTDPDVNGAPSLGVLAAYTTDDLACPGLFGALCSGGTGGGCGTIPACRTSLSGTLPSPATSANKKAKHVAKKLAALSTKADKALDKAAASSGKKQTRAYGRARKALQALLVVAGAADAKGTLGVPLAPLTAAVNALIALIPS
jgi:hypothetical protein